MKNISQKYLLYLVIFGISFFTLAILLSSTAISRAGQTHTQYGNDFTVFYAAARNLCYFGDPYNHPIAAKTPYLYLPLFSLLLAPLGLIPLPIAATCWYWLNILFTVLLIAISSKIMSSDLSKQIHIAIFLLISISRLVIDNLLWGQVNILVALLIAIWLLAHQKNKAWWGELALAIAISIKITPALLGFYLLVKRRWLKLIRLSICFLTINTISLLPLGLKAKPLLIGWFRRTILNGEGFNWAYAGNQSLKGAVERLFTSTSTESLYYPTVNLLNFTSKQSQFLFLLLAISLISYYVYKILKKNTNPHIAIAANCCLILLLSNLSWKAHFILLTIPLALLTKYSLYSVKPLSIISRMVLIIFFLLTIFTIQPILGAKLHEWFETHSYYSLIALIIFFVVVNSNEQENSQEFLINPNTDLN